jgi:hypothetical protein
MASVGLLAQYLLKLDPQKNVGRTTFYHFLKNYCDVAEPLSADIISRFYRRALTFQYWQTNQQTLGQTVEQDFLAFHNETPVAFDPKAVRHSHQMQLIELRYEQDIEPFLNSHLMDHQRAGERVKVLRLEDFRWMALRLSSSGLLDVEVYGPWALISGSDLTPMEPLTKLSYSSHLDLMPHGMNWVETAPLTTARFQILENGVHGHTVRGYTLQKYEALQGGSLNQHAEIFFALKKIERHFVQTETDPFYQELIALLEKSYNMLASNHPDCQRMAQLAVQKGHQALKSVFPHDKLLLLLVTNIEFLLNKGPRQSWKGRLRDKI